MMKNKKSMIKCFKSKNLENFLLQSILHKINNGIVVKNLKKSTKTGTMIIILLI